MKTKIFMVCAALVVSAAAVVNVACSQAGTFAEDKAAISVDINEMSPIDEFVCGESKYICLDSSDNSLIDNIDKVIMSQDTLFVVDKSRKTVFAFSANDGGFISKISRAGRGPGEYVALSDCDIWQGLIYILSYADQKLNVYSANGECLKSIKLPNQYSKLKVINGEKVWLYAENSNSDLYNFAQLDMASGEIDVKFDPFAENSSFHREASPFCGQSEDCLYVAKYFDSRIYALSDKGYKPIYLLRMNLQNKVPLADLEKYTPMELSEAYRYKEVLHNITAVMRRGNSLFIAAECFFAELGIRDCMIKYDLKSKRVHFLRIGDELDDHYRLFGCGKIVGYDHNIIISAIDALAVIRMVESDKISDTRLSGVKETDNPVIVLHNLAI